MLCDTELTLADSFYLKIDCQLYWNLENLHPYEIILLVRKVCQHFCHFVLSNMSGYQWCVLGTCICTRVVLEYKFEVLVLELYSSTSLRYLYLYLRLGYWYLTSRYLYLYSYLSSMYLLTCVQATGYTALYECFYISARMLDNTR